MAFPEIISTLVEGFAGYTVDFGRVATTYFLPEGDFVDLKTDHSFAVAQVFDA
ncbi:MAG TPA: hypothetical protein VFE60_26870 [Roseiarcus sp.]|jgi:hypothetical protein|nr:hypothetical protein [Roseiarcus sp.]